VIERRVQTTNSTPTFRPLRQTTLQPWSIKSEVAIRRNTSGSAASGLISSIAPWSSTFQTKQSSGGKRSLKKIPPILKASLRRDLLRSTNIASPKPQTGRNNCIHYANLCFQTAATPSKFWGQIRSKAFGSAGDSGGHLLDGVEHNGMPEVQQ
jgi:hypothetical protein